MDFTQIINWIVANWGLVTLLIFGLVALVVALSDWLKLNSQLRDLFLIAEKALADHVIKSGPDAMKAVVSSLYQLVPLRVRLMLKAVAIMAGTTDLAVLQWAAQRLYDAIKDRYARQLSLMALSETREWCTFVKRRL